MSAGHIAVKNKDFKLLKWLSQFPDINLDLNDADGETPIIYSISSKQFEMTKFLVSKGAKLEHKSH
jgi:ankyrin repeat protein